MFSLSWEDRVPAKNPQIISGVDRGLWSWLRTTAARDGNSVSQVVRDILMRVRDEEGERYWAAAGEERLKSFSCRDALEHDDVWD